MNLGGALLRTILVLAWVPSAEAYWARQLSPGWPPAFHTAPPPDVIETVQISLERLQAIGALLAVAIVLLATLTIVIGRKTKKKHPWRS